MIAEVGDRVHHRGQQWSAYDPEGGSPGVYNGWGVVVEVKPQRDGTTENRVLLDRPASWTPVDGTSWWASYHIDRVIPAEAPATKPKGASPGQKGQPR